MSKSINFIFLTVCACILIAAIAFSIPSSAQSAELFSFVKRKSSVNKPSSIASESEQAIEINFDALNSESAKAIRLPLPDGKLYDVAQAETEGFISRGTDDYTWRGKLEAENDWKGDVTLTVKGEALSGLIYAPSGTYEIVPQKDFDHLLIKLDQSRFPDSIDDGILPPVSNDEISSNNSSSKSGISFSSGETLKLDNGSQIDVLIVYTTAARIAIGGTTQTQALAQQAVAVTNTAYQNSGVATRLRLVQTMEISYVENGDAQTDLQWLTNNNPQIAEARNAAKADLVTMLTEKANSTSEGTTTGICGLAWRMSNTTSNFEPFGYSLVKYDCAVGNLTLAHEIGHNQGCHHNPENATGTPIYPYAYGHWNVSGNFRTIMSTIPQASCPNCARIQYFSNPSISVNNFPIGIPDQRDNTRVINNTALTISRFRDSGAAVTRNRKTVGVFRPTNGITYLRNSNTGGFADISMIYGVAGDTSIAGDWNGDNVDSLGIYRSGVFYLRNSNTTGAADAVIAFGQAGDQPVAGDWNGDGIDTIGVYRPTTGVFMLKNSNTSGAPDVTFVLGNPGDVAIAGDWNGDGTTTTGVFRPTNGIVYLKNTNVSGNADIYLVYGVAGDKPLAGDWDGDGSDSIGIYRGGVFYLRNSNTQGVADIVFAFGNPGDEPIAGDWDGLP